MQENRIRFNTFSGKDGRKWLNMVVIDDNHVYQFFSETKDFPIYIDDFVDRIWEVSSSAVQFRNAYVDLVAEDGTHVFLFCKIII